MTKFLGWALATVGALLLLLALLAAVGAVIALAERIKFGHGLMFADVEFLSALALLLGVFGGASLWLGRRLARTAAKGACN